MQRSARRKFRPTKRQKKDPQAYRREAERRERLHKMRLARAFAWLRRFVKVMTEVGEKFSDVERAALRLQHELLT